MKQTILLISVVTLLLSGCNENNRKADVVQEETTTKKMTREEIQAASFSELYKQIDQTEIPGDVFTLVNKDYTVLTGGTPEHYNSMIASWGGWGTLFDRPTTWCFLRSNRYTLELIRKDHMYTMSYFDDEYKDDIMPFGTQSGREGQKMKDTKLTAVQTPAGSMAFKEAKLIIECKLAAVTTVSADDFLVEDGRRFVVDAHAETNDYHKIVFGEITSVWVRK